MYGVFCFATIANSHTKKMIVPEAHFHAELIGTSPVKIAHKTAKLFKFLQGPTQHERTIVPSQYKICLMLHGGVQNGNHEEKVNLLADKLNDLTS